MFPLPQIAEAAAVDGPLLQLHLMLLLLSGKKEGKPFSLTVDRSTLYQAFFWTSEKKTQGKKTQALKKLKQIFQKLSNLPTPS